MSTIFKAVWLISFVLIGTALGVSTYYKAGGGTWSQWVGLYAFGFAVLFGSFGMFPGGTKVKNEWGEKVRVGNVFNLSRLQVIIFLGWVVGFGGVLAYLSVAFPNL
ncbi:hypothetical protein [Stutzerimonas nitrititolerans]|uniref:hypothetical protein n=1 Tax=Stutzerimonas nitrititolerans TaxID=2482751 RepID=UPI0028988D89|nr:hypothetical protein [Stutzerimonas nitrititolerans]